MSKKGRSNESRNFSKPPVAVALRIIGGVKYLAQQSDGPP